MRKAMVLLSGGIDSSTCLGIAVDQYGKENVSAVSISYGQKHSRELLCAMNVSKHYDVAHYILDLSEIFKYSNCSLLEQSTEDIPEGSYSDQIGRSMTGVVSTFVPFRNGVMLSAVTALALSTICPDDEVDVFIGAHADDAAGNAYPDCSNYFTYFMNMAIQEGTGKRVSLVSPFVNMNKADIVKLGLELNVPFEKTWSCYNGGVVPCGKCGTCIDREEAFKANGIEDPLLISLK